MQNRNRTPNDLEVRSTSRILANRAGRIATLPEPHEGMRVLRMRGGDAGATFVTSSGLPHPGKSSSTQLASIESAGNKAQAEKARIQAAEAIGKGDLDAAVSAYSEAIEADPSNARFYSGRAGVYMRLNKLPEALADAQKAKVASLPSDWHFMLARGCVCAWVGLGLGLGRASHPSARCTPAPAADSLPSLPLALPNSLHHPRFLSSRVLALPGAGLAVRAPGSRDRERDDERGQRGRERRYNGGQHAPEPRVCTRAPRVFRPHAVRCCWADIVRCCCVGVGVVGVVRGLGLRLAVACVCFLLWHACAGQETRLARRAV